MEKEQKNAPNPNIFKLIWFIYKRYYHDIKFAWQVWVLMLLELLSNIYPLLFSYLLARVIDKSISLINTGGAFEEMFPIIIIFGIVSILWTIINSLYQYVDSLVVLWISYLDDEVYLQRYLEIEPQAYEDPEFVNNKSTLNWNSSVVWNSFYQAFQILALVPIVVISFFAIFNISPLLAVLAIVASIPAAIIVKKFGKKIWGIWNDRGDEKVKYSSYKNSIWTTSFERYQEIFVFKYGKYLLSKAKALNMGFIRKLQANNKKRYTWTGVANVATDLVYLFAMIYSIKMVFDGHLTIGMLTFVLSAYDKFNRDISRLLNDSSTLLGNKKILEKFYTVQNWKNKIVSGTTNLPLVCEGISLEFRDVWFKYPNTKKWILKNLNFKINPDEDLAIVGKNGVGKTTLIKLMLRIYDPDKGDIFVNGINIKELSLDSYYRNVGILSQSFNQLGITAQENIYVGDVEKMENKEKMKEAAKHADIHSAITKLPSGYTTYLSRDIKGGIQLSGGQWQKLAIARAFYRDAKLLILDEPTSAVDALSEEKIFDNIRANAKNKTTLIVSHRFATVRKAKRIIVIDEGEIVEDGDHNSLINKNGLYSIMYNTQVQKD